MINSQNKIICPDCQSEISLNESLEVGEIVECQECGTELEITSVDPVSFRELVETK